jgi:adenylate cyclase
MTDEAVDKGEKQPARSERSDARVAGMLVRQQTVVLLVDLVESVRLMREHEAITVRRWADFVRTVTAEILPRHRGVLVKSLGDGLMARFEAVRDAVDTAAEIHQSLAAQNADIPEDQHFHLRAGINAAMAWSDGIDIYGTGVNLAARLATLAGPGETIASASVHEQLAAALASLANPDETIGSAAARDELTHGVDASCEDLGDCILKHFDEPVRAYRVGPASPHPSLTGRRDYGTPMEPTIAVIPFGARNSAPEHFDIGNLIADSVIWRLSKSANLKVISRLSTNVFRGRASDVGEVSAHLGASYILSGGYVVNAGQILVTAELSAARTNQVVWTDRLSGEIDDLLKPRKRTGASHRSGGALLCVRRRGRAYPDPAAAEPRELFAAAGQHQADAPLQQGGIPPDAQDTR